MPVGKRWCGAMLIGAGLIAFWGLSSTLARMGRLRSVCRWYRPSPAQVDYRKSYTVKASFYLVVLT